jgi:protein involved in polysaccharide export with SLBB domain
MRTERGGCIHACLRATSLLIVTLVSLCPAWVAAQTPTPTPAQLEQFRNLPPDQQQALLEALGTQNGGTTRRDPQLSQPGASTPQLTGQVPADEEAEEQGPPRITGGSTLLLDVKVRQQTPPREQAVLDMLKARQARISAGNPYRLDEEGRLSLPTLPPINLNGLTDIQAAQRLNFDPRLSGLEFVVTLLPVEPVGVEALKPFGYDVFGEAPTTFAPVTDLPVPPDYRIGPGDNVIVELFGKRTGRYQLVVGRNGALTIPELGPIQVVGLTFDQMRQEIDERVSQQMIGVSASVTMGQLRSIRVFVVGDVKQPGAYTISALSTITNALFASGGVTQIGSLRAIQLKRGGKTVTTLDLYDLLLRGDTSKDLPLQQGDAIFVPPLGNTATVAGEVRRPAIYEFRDGATAGEIVDLAGGLNPDADPRAVRLERINPNHERVVLNLDLSSAEGRNRQLLAGDVLTIPKVFSDTRGVTLEGHVHRPGSYAWREGMRLTDLLGSPQMFKLNADQRYVLIRRESLPDRHIEVISADATRAFANRGSADDPLLQSRDRVIVFSRAPERGPALADLLQELRLQARDNEPVPIVTITGRVRAPGDYPLEAGMTLDDLIRAGGGLEDAAHGGTAELTRYEVVNGEARRTEVIDVNLAGEAVAANPGATLRPYDVLVIKETPDWREKESITLVGEVRFPGTYPIRKGESLSSVIERAGGLTDEAFPKGSVFTREELKEQERKQIENLAQRLRADLALLAFQGAQVVGRNTSQDPTDVLAAGQALLTQLQAAEPTGRLVINLQAALRRPGSEEDIELRNGDVLLVPRLKQYVTVIGEVQNATTHVYKSGLDRNDYIELSGGLTQRADAKRIYVVRADGSVMADESRSWFGGSNSQLEPGDTIVVPLDAERMRPLPLWTAVTTIIYNLAVAVAAIGSL